MLTIAIETPLQDDVREMVASLNDYLRPLSPPEFQFQMTAEQMAGHDTSVFVARNVSNEAIGMGSLKVENAEMGEVKRMFTKPEIRGDGTGRKILNAIEALARQIGLSVLKLETGATPGFEPAWRVYERGGFSQCAAFLDYPDSGFSKFYEKKLT